MTALATAPPRRPQGLALAPDAPLRAWLTIGLVVLALLAGGGGADTPPAVAMIVELAALIALAGAALCASGSVRDPRSTIALLLAALIAATMAAQLVPLPPGIWRALPGREISTEVRALLGLSDARFPFALDPDRARAAGYALLPPIAAFVCTLYAGVRLRHRLLIAIVAVALLDLLLGTLQFAARGQSAMTIYATPHAGTAVGLFANRNHNADLLLIAPLLVAALLRDVPGRRLDTIAWPTMLGTLAVCLFGELITTSRMGLLLMLVPVLGVLLLFSSRGRSGRRVLIVAGGAVLGAALLVTLAMTNDVAGAVLARFDGGSDPRFAFWPDVIYAIGQLWPFGSGSGTFDPVFRSVERLDIVTQFYVNHAHNEYLEIALELGVWGVSLIVAFLLVLARMAVPEFAGRRGRPLDPLPVAALFGIAVLLLHSLVDYPLRTFTLATLFGVLCGLLFRPATAPR